MNISNDQKVGVSKLQTKKIAKKMIELFIKEFPRYIEISSQMKVFENLKIQKNRVTFGAFSDDLQKFYDRRIKSFNQRGILEELRF
jgi:hypothetical protein